MINFEGLRSSLAEVILAVPSLAGDIRRDLNYVTVKISSFLAAII